jgi:hypothetical protein
MAGRSRRARLEDVHELALGMPHVTVVHGRSGNPVYQVGGKSFVFFRTPRPDAVDPDTGERYPDVVMFWVTSEADKQALVQDRASPFFTTAHSPSSNWPRSSRTPGSPAPPPPAPPPGSAPGPDHPPRSLSLADVHALLLVKVLNADRSVPQVEACPRWTRAPGGRVPQVDACHERHELPPAAADRSPCGPISVISRYA